MGEQDTEYPEHSIWDGAGNEIKVVTAPDEEGRLSQGTGETTEEALADAREPGEMLGKGYGSADY